MLGLSLEQIANGPSAYHDATAAHRLSFAGTRWLLKDGFDPDNVAFGSWPCARPPAVFFLTGPARHAARAPERGTGAESPALVAVGLNDALRVRRRRPLHRGRRQVAPAVERIASVERARRRQSSIAALGAAPRPKPSR